MIFQKISEVKRKAFFSTIIFGLLAFGYMFTNKITSNDDLGTLYVTGGAVVNGRWMTGLFGKVFPLINSPWTNGCIVLLFMGLSAMLLMDILKIKSSGLAIALSAIWVTYPCIASTTFYMFLVSPYIVGLTLMVLAVWIIDKKANLIYAQLAVACIILSMGFYQAYFPVAAGLLLILLFVYVVQNNDIKQIVKRSLLYFLVLFEGMFGYILVQRILLYLTGAEATSYQNISNIGHFDFSLLPQQISQAYAHFFKAWSYFDSYSVAFSGLDVVFAVLFAGMFVYCIYYFVREKLLFNGIVTAIIIMLFPLACNLVYLYGAEYLHSLMVQGNVCAVFLIVAFLTQTNIDVFEKYQKRIVNTMEVFIILIACLNCELDNRAFMQQEYIVQSSIMYLNNVVAQIKTVEGYDDEMPVAFVGVCIDPAIDRIDSGYHTINLAGANTMQQVVNTAIRWDWTRPAFFGRYLGFSTNFLNWDSCAELQKRPEIQDMPIYPDDGSIKVVDGIVVVHFSDYV